MLSSSAKEKSWVVAPLALGKRVCGSVGYQSGYLPDSITQQQQQQQMEATMRDERARNLEGHRKEATRFSGTNLDQSLLSWITIAERDRWCLVKLKRGRKGKKMR